MLHCLLDSQPGSRTSGEELLAEVLRLTANVLPPLPNKTNVGVLNLLNTLRDVEGRATAEENVEDDPDAPHVRRHPIPSRTLDSVPPLENLGRKVLRGTAEGPKTVLVGPLGQTKVCDLDPVVVRLRHEEDVLRLQVPVDDLLGVEVADGREHPPHGPAGIHLRSASGEERSNEWKVVSIVVGDMVRGAKRGAEGSFPEERRYIVLVVASL